MRRFWFGLIPLVLCACGETSEVPDVLTDVLTDVLSDVLSDGTVAAIDAPAPHPTTGPRAYVITAEDTADLAPGDLAQAAIGDIVIRNDHVRFVIHATGESLYLQGLGAGLVIDAGEPADDRLMELVPAPSFNGFGKSTVAITSDGNSGVAEVTVVAEAMPVPLINEWIPGIGIEGTLRQHYRLTPDARALEMELHIETDAAVIPAEAFFAGGEAKVYLPDDAGWLVAEGPNISYALISNIAVLPTKIDTLMLLLGEEIKAPAVWKRWLAIGDGSMSSVVDQAMTLRGDPTVAISGTVDDKDALIGAYDKAGKLLSRFRADAKGEFKGLLPPGPCDLRAEGPGRAPGALVSLDLVAGTPKDGIAVAAQPTSKLVVTAEEPLRITVIDATGDDTVLPVAPGTTELPLVPGTWKVYASRGFEYELDQTTLELPPSGSATWSPKLVRSVDTSGWIASEFHLHSEWSTDSSVPLRDRILACAAEGVEYAVATDHDVVTDYRPYVLPSLEGRIQVASGCETSTAKWGHVNAWPWTMDRTRGGRGAPVWYGKDFPGVMEAVGAGTPGHVVQINHPRGGGVNNLWDISNFDPEDADPSQLAMFTFNAQEIYNGGGDGEFQQQLHDWLMLVEHGLPIAATGVSDAHSIDALCGHPRTLVEVKDDNVATVKPADIDLGVLAQHTMVTSGPFITMAAAGPGKVHVRIAAPSWMPVETVALYANAVPDRAVDVPAYSGDVVRFDEDVELLNATATRVVAVARAKTVPVPMKRKIIAVTPVLHLGK